MSQPYSVLHSATVSRRLAEPPCGPVARSRQARSTTSKETEQRAPARARAVLCTYNVWGFVRRTVLYDYLVSVCDRVEISLLISRRVYVTSFVRYGCTVQYINLNQNTYRQSLARGPLRMFERTVGHKGQPVTDLRHRYRSRQGAGTLTPRHHTDRRSRQAAHLLLQP